MTDKQRENERAVSPVIGVILMVAITVILAAVIAAFVLDFGDTSQSAQADFGVDKHDDEWINVTVRNADRIDALRFGGDCGEEQSVRNVDLDDFNKSVGDTFSVEFDDCNDGDRINFVATYDGTDTIVRTYRW